MPDMVDINGQPSAMDEDGEYIEANEEDVEQPLEEGDDEDAG